MLALTCSAPAAQRPSAAPHPLGTAIAENLDPALLNLYGVIPVDPDKGNINAALARRFVEWLTSVPTQSRIEAFGVDTFGQPLFYPGSDAWRDR